MRTHLRAIDPDLRYFRNRIEIEFNITTCNISGETNVMTVPSTLGVLPIKEAKDVAVVAIPSAYTCPNLYLANTLWGPGAKSKSQSPHDFLLAMKPP